MTQEGRPAYAVGMKPTAKLSSKSQITIPAWVRKKLGIGPGSRLAVRVEDERILLERVEDSVLRLEGALRGVYGKDPDRYIRGLRREWERRPSL